MMNEPRKKCAQGFLKIRILSYVITQPASFCFILSLFLIAIELIALGIYVAKKDHMPDLDAMKVNNKPEASSYHELSLQIIHLFHVAIDRRPRAFFPFCNNYDVATVKCHTPSFF